MTFDLKTFLLQIFQSWTFCPEKKKNRKWGRWGCIWNQDAGLENGYATCLKRGLIQPLRPVPTPLQWVCAHIFCPDISVLHPENENMQGHIQPVAITSSDTAAAAAALVPKTTQGTSGFASPRKKTTATVCVSLSGCQQPCLVG